MIKTVVRGLRWSPKKIDNLYVDHYDHHGIIYWYQDAVQVNKELKAAYSKNGKNG
jgi:hypothetical protein